MARGYGVVRSTLLKEDGWIIGPLFADNSSIARAILQDLFRRVAVDDALAIVVMDVPHGSEFRGSHLTSSMIAKESQYTHMCEYTEEIPEGMQLTKVFGLTSLTVGP